MMYHDASPGTPNTSKPATKASARPKRSNPISDHFAHAIKRPGALTALVGGKPSEHIGTVRNIAATGTPLQKKQANFYLNILR